MKTIFIPVFFGHVARNILRTSVLPALLQSARVVVFIPLSKEKFYRAEFSHPNLVLEAVYFKTDNQWSLWLHNLAFLFLDSNTNFIKQSLSSKKHNVKYFLKICAIKFFSQLKFLMAIYHRLYLYLMKDNFFDSYFDKYHPDLIFCPHIYAKEDLAMLREAKKRKIKTVAMVNSWDNLSNRGMIKILPDTLLVHNDCIKQEALRWSEIKEKNVIVVGMPHFDYYVNYQPDAKEEFWKKIGADPKKRLLLFCPPIKALACSWKNLLADLKNCIINGNLPADLQILVRFAPTEDEDISQFDLADPLILYDKPGHYFNPAAFGDATTDRPERQDWEFTWQDMRHFANSLYYCAMVINYASTLNIDGAAFNKPLIDVVFDDRPAYGSKFVKWVYLGKDHNQRLFATNGAKLVYDVRELITAINNYLNNPALDQLGRMAIVHQQCWQLDGEAGKRIAAVILNYFL